MTRREMTVFGSTDQSCREGLLEEKTGHMVQIGEFTIFS